MRLPVMEPTKPAHTQRFRVVVVMAFTLRASADCAGFPLQPAESFCLQNDVVRLSLQDVFGSRDVTVAAFLCKRGAARKPTHLLVSA